MTRDEMIETMARAIGNTIYRHPGLQTVDGRLYTEACSAMSLDLLSAIDKEGLVVVPAALLKEYRPTMAEDVLRHWAAELYAAQQEKTDG